MLEKTICYGPWINEFRWIAKKSIQFINTLNSIQFKFLGHNVMLEWSAGNLDSFDQLSCRVSLLAKGFFATFKFLFQAWFWKLKLQLNICYRIHKSCTLTWSLGQLSSIKIFQKAKWAQNMKKFRCQLQVSLSKDQSWNCRSLLVTIYSPAWPLWPHIWWPIT